MEDILASIRETVEEEVEKSSGSSASADVSDDVSTLLSTEDDSEGGDENAETPVDDDITNELLSESSDVEGEDSGLLATDTALENTGVDDADMVEASEALAAMSAAKSEMENKKDSMDDDILELTDVVDENSNEEGLIDVNAFSNSGEMVSADKNSIDASRASYVEDELKDDDIDVDVESIMSEMKEDGDLPSEGEDLPSEDEATDMMSSIPDEDDTHEDNIEDMIGEESTAEDSMSTDTVPTATAPTDAMAAATEKVVEHAVQEVAQKVFLPTTPSAKGLQVSFPSEVLAEALRPLVTGWIEENLADIVERLVKEELSKLVEK